ncbi:MAG: glycosyltransferase family 2 protein [Chthoniobacterales bacterium]|nr:glycosyltransferase family 2 protein [Chthoniobacterales bacterium]
MRISVIIPTFKRPDYLAKALRGLAGQLRPADQIVLGVREEDGGTAEFLATSAYAVTTATARKPGVIASMNAALAKTDGDIVCLLDDDAEPLPDWLQQIEKRFAEDPRLGMLGGRDLLRDHPEMRDREPLTARVGVFTWYGRFLGNHHRGGGGYRRVDTLKGCNAAARGDLLRRIGFERGLRGEGAQVHWEIALCLDVAAAGFSVAYDPALRVIHHIAPRYGVDQSHRGGFSAEGLFDMVWNEHYVVSRRLPAGQRIRHALWAVLVGSLDAPGLVQYARLVLRRDPRRKERFAITRRAIREGRKAGCA